MALNLLKNRCYVIDVNIGTTVGPEFTITPWEYFTLNFLILTLSFWNVPKEKEIKYNTITPIFKILNENYGRLESTFW